MLKKLSKSILATLLAICIAVSTYSTALVSFAATESKENAVKGIMKEVAIDKLVETGMRLSAEICEGLGKATGTQEGEEIFSFISNWVFSSGVEATANKTKELCEDIINQIDDLTQKINQDFSVVESQLSQSEINAAKRSLKFKWFLDVDARISAKSASRPLNSYKKYLKDAITYNNTINNSEKKSSESELQALNDDLDGLLNNFYNMHISNKGESADGRGKEYAMFTSDELNVAFEELITNLATALDNKNSGSVEECAVQYACDAFQFSHQQYSFVHKYVEKQILVLLLVSMMYNEYLYQQGTFIENYNYKSETEKSKDYKMYLERQDSFFNLLAGDVKEHITNMLNRELIADSSQKFSLDTYMKPEDAVADDLRINGYKTLYYHNSDVTYREYIYDTVRFNRVMTHSNNNRNVYYILDPSQFSNPNALKTLAMDTKIDKEGAVDTHIPSADYINLTQKTMFDGTNTFACSKNIFGLFDTNAFRWYDSIPSAYLGYYSDDPNALSSGYLPNGTVLIMTPEYEYGSVSPFSTTYETFEVIEGDTPLSGSDTKTETYSASKFQPDQGGDKYTYSVILANNSNEYKQKATFNIPAHLEVSVSDSSGNTIIDTTEAATPSARISSGEMITIKFKIDDGYIIEAANCIRNNITQTETLLFDNDDVNILKSDDDYYIFSYPMPYSETTFDFNVVADEIEYNIWTPEDLIKFSYDMSNGVNPEATANLCADIDMTGYEEQFSPIGNAKNPFNGTFNGNNHKIEGLELNDFDCCGLFGCIDNNAIIKDVTVSGNFSISHATAVKRGCGVVGYANGGRLTNIKSYINVRVVGVVVSTGGIVGTVVKDENDTIIENCMFGGILNFVDSGMTIGGIVGRADGGVVIKSCANVGAIITSDSIVDVGGILGYLKGESVTIENCYNYSKLGASQEEDPDSCFGAIIGCIDESNVSINISDNYYLDTSCDKVIGDSYSDIDNINLWATQKTDVQFSSGEVTYLLNHKITDGSQIWYQNIDNGKQPDNYPMFEGGTVYFGYVCNGHETKYSNYPLSNSPSEHIFNNNGFCIYCDEYQPATYNDDNFYEIGNAGQLYWFASLVNGDKTHAEFETQDTSANAVLTADITVNSNLLSSLNNDGSLPSDVTVRSWTPIGNYSTSSNTYSGTFDGQGHTISGLYNSSTNKQYIGLFGYNVSGTIKHLGVVDSCFVGNSMVGGICGRNHNIIENCYSDSKVSGSEYVGGVCGNNFFGSIISSHNVGTVNAKNMVGGVCGDNLSGEITNCYYLDICNSNSTSFDNKFGTAKTEAEFSSGEVSYLLNNNVTDGTQIWYQNIDNGEITDDYPVFNGGTVYYLENDDRYSNSDVDIEYEFDVDENGNFIIKTYDDLVKLSELVISDYSIYGNSNYVLANNIIAPQDSKWAKGIGSVDENKPFNGTFDGNGYIISRMNIDSGEYGGLFEYVGAEGKITQLVTICLSFNKDIKTAGAIAAVNDGTIDHCISGVNLTSGVIFYDWDNDGEPEKIVASQLNSNVKGEITGGIAAVNNGSIIGCRNASVFNDTKLSGGISGINYGLIYGCANSGSITSSNTESIGGIAGINAGSIKSSYNSGKLYGDWDDVIGSVAGVNISEDVSNVFYICINGIKAIGAKSTAFLDDTNKEKSKSDMITDAFVEELNTTVKDYDVTWTRNETRNNGYPTIQCYFYETATRTSKSGISVSGKMHSALNINYLLCDSDSQTVNLFNDYGKEKVMKVYEPLLVDNDGNQILSELWTEGKMKISIPISDENIQILTADASGIISEVSYAVENGYAVFYTEELQSLAVISTVASNGKDNAINSDNSKDNTINNSSTIDEVVTPSDNTAVKTGRTIALFASFAVIAMFAAFAVIQMKNKFEYNNTKERK